MALDYAHGAIQWLAADAATTTYDVTGLSFQPKALRFWWVGLQNAADALSATTSERRGMGFAVSTSARRCVGSFSEYNAAAMNCGTVARNDAVACTTDGAAGSDGELDLNAINSDGFQLIVDDATPANLTIFWEAWGGSDISVAVVGDIATPSASGNQNYTATGFSGSAGANEQVVFFAGVQATAAVNTAEASDSGFCIGAAASTTAADNICVGGNSDDGSLSADTDGWCLDGQCIGMVAQAGAATMNMRATLTAFGTDLFTLNYAESATANRRFIFMAIRGGQWDSGSYTIEGQTGSATATVSGLPFAPKGLNLMGRMTAEQAADVTTAEDRIGIGCGTSTTDRRSMGVLEENGAANTQIDMTIQYDQVLSFPSATGTLQSAYDINAMNSDGFQIIVDTNGGVTAEWQGYVTWGDAAVAAAPEVVALMAPMRAA